MEPFTINKTLAGTTKPSASTVKTNFSSPEEAMRYTMTPYSTSQQQAASQWLLNNGSVLGASDGGSTPAPTAPRQVSSGPTYKDTSAARSATQQSIDALSTAKGVGEQNIDSELAGLLSKYDKEMGANETDFKTQSDTNTRNKLKNKQNALLAASQGRRGLMGVLSSMGALSGTGSELANKAVATEANTDIGEATDTAANNAVALESAIKKSRDEDTDRKAEAQATAKSKKTALSGNIASQEKTYYEKMAELLAEAGMNTEAGTFLSKAGALSEPIARAGAVTSTQYAPRSAAFTPGSLSDYLAGAGNMTVSTKKGANGGKPTLTATNLEKKKKLEA